MKTKLIIAFCLLISLLSFGQGTYKSFIHSGVTKWLYYSPQDGCMLEETDAYGDTVINQITYKKLWDIHFLPQPPYNNVNQQWRDYTQFTGLTNTFIRQSSDSSKLYLYDGNQRVEHLIVDMNLKVGDEFIFPGLGSDVVENIIYNNGVKVIEFKNHMATSEKLSFIEGIGLNRDYFFIIRGNIYYPTGLLCYSNSSNFYIAQYFTYCACVDTKIEDIEIDKYEIVKFSDLIEISFDKIIQRNWELYDIYGRKIQKSEILNQQIINIPTSDLKAGIYMLRIYNHENNKYTSLKLIL